MALVTPTVKLTDFASDRLRVSPDLPSTRCGACGSAMRKTKAITKGFSNEGLWPLCQHRAYPPDFRPGLAAVAENQSPFADTVLQRKWRATESPISFAQPPPPLDYHFALLPRMVKEARPGRTRCDLLGTFRGRIRRFLASPWQRELVDGIAAADLIGFQFQSHCNNFLTTVDARSALTSGTISR